MSEMKPSNQIVDGVEISQRIQRKLLNNQRATSAFLVTALVIGGGILAACGTSSQADTTLSATTPSAAATTTEVIGTTTTTVYAGPPTLAPGETLPTPIDPPRDTKNKDPKVEIGTFEIPKLEVKETIYEGIRLPTYDIGVGHWPGTALPGQVGNVVIGGHRTSGIAPFRDLDKLIKGDEIIVTTDKGTFVYVVDGSTIIKNPDDSESLWIIQQTQKATMTLFACHPPGSTRERYIIFANYDRVLSV